MRFKKKLLQRLDQGYVEPVEPDDRFPRIVRVIMPAKLGSQDQIALFHHALLSINRCIGPIPLENETQCSGSVPVPPTAPSRLDVMKSEVEAMRGRRTFSSGSIKQTDCPT